MNSRNLWIAVIAAGLLAAVALGLLMRAGNTPAPNTAVRDVPPLTTAPAPHPRTAPRVARKAPDAPREVADDAFVVTASGLRIHDFEVGAGARPEVGQTVKVEYTGWLQSGRKFDSSFDRAEALTFAVGTGGVIAGWDEGILSMQVGGKRQLVIPSDLAYGPSGRPPVIPPDATLIFEVELVAVE